MKYHPLNTVYWLVKTYQGIQTYWHVSIFLFKHFLSFFIHLFFVLHNEQCRRNHCVVLFEERKNL